MSSVKYCFVTLCVIALYFIKEGNAVCCKSKNPAGFGGRKCPFFHRGCLDGSCVNNFQCCGKVGGGGCNIVCCNCGGGCRTRSSETSAAGAFSSFANNVGNTIGDAPEAHENPKEVFDTIDIDANGKISLEEMADYLSYKHSGNKRLVKRYVADPMWFSQMDSNDNGFIEPGELDADLK